MEFKDNLKQIRKKRGLTQAQLAEKAGLSYSAIVNYENGRRKEIQGKYLFKLANVLNVKPEELMPGLYEWLDETAADAIAEEKERQKQWVVDRFNNDDEGIISLIAYYIELNEDGKKEAVSRVGELLYNPRYNKE